MDRDKLWHIIAREMDCERECKKYPEGCGCALRAAEAILAAPSAREAVLLAVLRDCREYFLARAKATWPHGKETPNEEMRLLFRIEQVTEPGVG